MVFDINKLNALIDKASRVLSCDANCQRNQQIASLRQKMQVAIDNKQNAPQRLDKAVKDYIVYSKGAPVFNDYQATTLKAEAKQNVVDYKAKYDDVAKQIQINLTTYSGLLVNYNNLLYSNQQYEAENKKLNDEFKKANSDTNTNQRKTFYENENIDSLNYYYSIIRFIYVIVIIVYCYLFIRGSFSRFSFRAKIIVLVLLIVYPFVSTRLLNFFLMIYSKIVSVLPTMPFKKREGYQTGTSMTRQTGTGYGKRQLQGQPTPT